MAIKIIPIPPTLLSTETVLYEIKITYSATEEGSLLPYPYQGRAFDKNHFH